MFFFFQAEDGIRDIGVTGVQTCALPISEAASLAGHLKLGKLIYFYDDNQVTIEGPTALAFSEDVPKRFDSYGWHTLTVEDRSEERRVGKECRSRWSPYH